MLRGFLSILLTAVGLTALLASCSNGQSDATRVMDNNATGTISALNSQLHTAQATITAAGTVVARLAKAQTDVANERATNLANISRINETTPFAPNPPVDVSSGGPAALPTAPGAVAAQAVPAATQVGGTPGSGMTLDTPVTAKNIDGSGCAISPATAFLTTDSKIWVVAKAHNMKKGVQFTASWSGAFNHQDTWTSAYPAAQICIHFYVEPKTLNLTAGDWTVSISTPDVSSASASFQVSGQASNTTPAAAPTKGTG